MSYEAWGDDDDGLDGVRDHYRKHLIEDGWLDEEQAAVLQLRIQDLERELAATQQDEARELLAEVVRRYDDYRGKGVMPAPGEYQMVVGAIERIRAYLARTGRKETL